MIFERRATPICCFRDYDAFVTKMPPLYAFLAAVMLVIMVAVPRTGAALASFFPRLPDGDGLHPGRVVASPPQRSDHDRAGAGAPEPALIVLIGASILAVAMVFSLFPSRVRRRGSS